MGFSEQGFALLLFMPLLVLTLLPATYGIILWWVNSDT